ncbi:unnamed protein product [Ceratitis capitata]|uniref:(Mediterranean fruit fly) hypothetical protein n=1 Tax=Ceratitis capitata TaxID=7213 RepID=A0A811V1M8_CERCA|nr:unnamed protein product [Ceratitis capitata]
MCTHTHLHFCATQLITITLSLIATALLQQTTGAPAFVSHKNCNDVAKGTIVANPGNCSQYIICNGLRSTLGECPADTYFNPNILSCDKTSVACAVGRTITTATTASTASITFEMEVLTSSAPPQTTRRPINSIQPPSGNKSPSGTALAENPSLSSIPSYERLTCTIGFDQQFPHPNICEYYFHCVSGYLSVRRCHFGFGWDLDRQHCVPLQQAKCVRP